MKTKRVKMKLADLIEDFALYPRDGVDGQHVHYMRESIRAGQSLGPIRADEKSKRITDGFHRRRAMMLESGENIEAEVDLVSYPDEAAMFLDAMRCNATHGRSLTTHDRVICIVKAERFKLTSEQVAEALALTTDRLGELKAGRLGQLRSATAVGAQKSNGHEVLPLKRTIKHMAGRLLTKEQAEANDKLGGMQQTFFVNQVILLIENNLLDPEDEKLWERLRVLHGLLEEALAAK